MTSPWARGGRQNHRLKRLGISLVMASVDHLSVRAGCSASTWTTPAGSSLLTLDGRRPGYPDRPWDRVPQTMRADPFQLAGRPQPGLDLADGHRNALAMLAGSDRVRRRADRACSWHMSSSSLSWARSGVAGMGASWALGRAPPPRPVALAVVRYLEQSPGRRCPRWNV